MQKQTSAHVSTIAARIMEWAKDPNDLDDQTLADIKSLAASCLSQDETPGQVDAPAEQEFLSRLKTERAELSERLDKLTKFLAGDGFRKLPAIQRELLEAQRIHMGEYLHVLDARLTDLGISQRSADTSFDPKGEKTLREIADENAVDTGENSNAG